MQHSMMSISVYLLIKIVFTEQEIMKSYQRGNCMGCMFVQFNLMQGRFSFVLMNDCIVTIRQVKTTFEDCCACVCYLYTLKLLVNKGDVLITFLCLLCFVIIIHWFALLERDDKIKPYFTLFHSLQINKVNTIQVKYNRILDR